MAGGNMPFGFAPTAEMSSYTPTLTERATDWLRRKMFTDDREGQQKAERVMNVAQYTPFGFATDMYDAGRAGGQGDYAGAGLMLGMAVLPGYNPKMKYPMAPRDRWYGDANYEATGGRVVEMTPDEFLAKARPMQIDDVARDNIDDLKRHIQEGGELDPLAIYKNGKEDGRHRAIAARELGVSKVPVLVWDSPSK